MNQLSDLRLKLAEVASEREAAEKERRKEVEEEIKEVHQRYIVIAYGTVL